MVEFRTTVEYIEYTRQMLMFGDVQLDADGHVVMDREDPDVWKHFVHVGGRGHGKTSMQHHLASLHEEVQRLIDKTDQLHRLAAGWRTAPQGREAQGIAGVRWACTKPTTPAYAPGSYGWFVQNYGVQINHPRTELRTSWL